MKVISHLLCFLFHCPAFPPPSMFIRNQLLVVQSESFSPNYLQSGQTHTLAQAGKKPLYFSPPDILSDLHHDSLCIFIIQTGNQSSRLSLHVCLVRV